MLLRITNIILFVFFVLKVVSRGNPGVPVVEAALSVVDNGAWDSEVVMISSKTKSPFNNYCRITIAYLTLMYIYT